MQSNRNNVNDKLNYKLQLPDSKAEKENLNKIDSTFRNQGIVDTGRFNVQFFSEGGNLIEGITSKVAVKALRGTGHGFVV